ncbi:nucleic acid/nucleotide deaminase domain-containing protein [Nocardia sp. BMG111209]|uniref:nucleic acid/nucleotide deaminase domain-containing protein n=1 Tax=Nocardia sp. BMG111209 TaxID=1160137 RepID=UPI0003AB1034|nr:nucleic acid/nucleotide deaminase domain-containing protein [Nocardia sp. BMG111209]
MWRSRTVFGKRRIRRGAGFGTVLLSLAVLAGCGTTVSGHAEPRADTAPFYLAVVNLLSQPVAHYTGISADGSANWDLRATDSGESLGSLTRGNHRTDLLTAGNRTYAKPPPDALPTLPGSVGRNNVAGRWLTGADDLTAGLPRGSWSSQTVGAALLNALDTTPEFPRIGDPTVPVGNDRAVEVTTPVGVLDVSATEPYRVLQLKPAPEGTRVTPAVRPAAAPSTTPDPEDPDAPHGPLPVSESPLSDDVGPIVFVPMTFADMDRTYDDLIAQTRTLTDAIDVGIDFHFDQSGALSCNTTSCTVTANATTSTTATRPATLSGTVTASMAATVTVNGRPAGGCGDTRALPINGSGTLSCVDPEVAAVVSQISAENQAQADAQARAAGHNVSVPYTINYNAHIEMTALAGIQAVIDLVVATQQNEQRAIENRAGPCSRNSFVAGTAVLMADGTTRPIETVAEGDEIRNAAPGSPATQPNRVTAIHRTDEDRDFVRVTVAGPNGTGTIETTAAHRFYDTTTATWTEAATLTPGDHLQTTTGTAVVEAVDPYTATTRTYNLTVEGTPTFFVVTNGTAVLVHNCTYTMVPYNGDELSRAAYRARMANGPYSPKRNVAAAKVPGWNDPTTGDIVVGFSKGRQGGTVVHAEDDIMNTLKAKGVSPDRITALYTERQPCSEKCEPMLEQTLKPDAAVTYSVPWGDDPLLRQAADELLAKLIEQAGGG